MASGVGPKRIPISFHPMELLYVIFFTYFKFISFILCGTFILFAMLFLELQNFLLIKKSINIIFIIG